LIPHPEFTQVPPLGTGLLIEIGRRKRGILLFATGANFGFKNFVSNLEIVFRRLLISKIEVANSRESLHSVE